MSVAISGVVLWSRIPLRSCGLLAAVDGLDPVTVKGTDHYKVMREFCNNPMGFVEAAIEE
jgi:hypothetical protein